MRALPLALAVATSCLLPGCALFSQLGQAAEEYQNFRNDGVRMNLRTVDLALSLYARDHKGLYPARASWLPDLQRGYYLPNNKLPPNPWVLVDENSQNNMPASGDLAVPTDGGVEPTSPGTVLGKGEKPSAAPYLRTTFGAVLYEVSPNRRICVVYGVGQNGDNAIVADFRMRGVR